MTVAAHVIHVTRGRARFRLPSAKGDAAFFERVERELRGVRGVTSVKVNARTGSVLLRHRGDLEDVVAQARERGVFDVTRAEPPPRRDPLESVREHLLGLNASVRRRTGETADLRTVAFAALLGGSVYQLMKGDFLPAGGTMLMQAIDVVLGQKRRDE